jgi:transcriptional regulator with XRE-family HTH domain
MTTDQDRDLSAGARKFQAWIKQQHLTHREVGERFHWGESVISKLTRGKQRPGLASALKLEQIAGIPPQAWL